MKRSRAFVLAEILMTMMLQAGFILVLCTSFYMLTSFYSKTQQVLTARSHAERVISFVDDKIKNAGLGLWNCKNPPTLDGRQNSWQVRDALRLFTKSGRLLRNFKLPVAVMRNATNVAPQYLPGDIVQYGTYLTLLYAARDLSSGADENILIVKQSAASELVPGSAGTADSIYKTKLQLIDNKGNNPKNIKELFKIESGSLTNMENYAVAEGAGLPMCIISVSDSGELVVYTYASPLNLADASELMLLKCMQMFVQDKNDGHGRQFAFRETVPVYSNADWGNTYNQEKGILEIYMELDTSTNIFTLYVLAQGGYDASVSNPRPSTSLWPEKAKWDEKEYPHFITYVSRASWKLNNIPPNFDWSN